MMSQLSGINEYVNDNAFKSFLKMDDDEIKRWLILAEENANNPPLVIDCLESAINKYPNSRILVDTYQKIIDPLISSQNQLIRKNAIERNNRVLRVYLDNCTSDDWNHAYALMDKVLMQGNELMNEIVENSEDMNTKVLEEMEKILSQDKKLSDNDMQLLEKLDLSINIPLLEKNPSLRERYQIITNKLVALFNNESNNKQIRDYNFKAINYIRDAYTAFYKHEKEFKKGDNLQTLVWHLGGWDFDKLLPSTQIYQQSVYSEIFAQLDPDAKVSMAKKMLDATSKEINK